MGNNVTKPEVIPTTEGSVTYQPFVNEEGIQIAAEKHALQVEGNKMISNGVRNIDILQPIRVIDVAEVNNPSIWTRVPPRPVYIWQGRLGLCIVMFERIFETGSGFALQRNTRFLAVRKVAPVDPSIVQVTEDIHEVAARKAIENVERGIFLFRPEEDLVRIIQADGTTYDEPWTVFQQSGDPRDIRALSMLSTDFPIIWNYVASKPGKKKQDLFYPNENRIPEEPKTLDDMRGELDNLSNREQPLENAELVARATAKLEKSRICGNQTPFNQVSVQNNNSISLNVSDSMKELLDMTMQGKKHNANICEYNRKISNLPGSSTQTPLPPRLHGVYAKNIPETEYEHAMQGDKTSLVKPKIFSSVAREDFPNVAINKPRQTYQYKKYDLAPVVDASVSSDKNVPHMDLQSFRNQEMTTAEWMKHNRPSITVDEHESKKEEKPHGMFEFKTAVSK